jgi:hypothetical protein
VFGVVVTEMEAEPPRGGWCDAQTYLKTPPWSPLRPHLAAPSHRSGGADSSGHRPPVAALLRNLWPSWVPEPPITPCTCCWWPRPRASTPPSRVTAIARTVETLYEEEADGDVDLDAFHDGTAAAYRLLEARTANPSLVVDEALRLHAGQTTIMLIAMAVSLAGEGAPPSAGPAAES